MGSSDEEEDYFSNILFDERDNVEESNSLIDNNENDFVGLQCGGDLNESLKREASYFLDKYGNESLKREASYFLDNYACDDLFNEGVRVKENMRSSIVKKVLRNKSKNDILEQFNCLNESTGRKASLISDDFVCDNLFGGKDGAEGRSFVGEEARKNNNKEHAVEPLGQINLN